MKIDKKSKQIIPNLKIQTIDEYINIFPINVQKRLEKIRQVIKKTVTESEEAISYGIPTFKLNGNLVHFAGYKNHIGFYPGAKAIVVFKKEISSYKHAKGSIQFPIEEPIPYGLIKKIVEFRVKENLNKKSK